MKTTYTLIALMTFAIASGALAGNMNKGQNSDRNKMQPPAFSQFDLDGNGEVTELEFNQARAERIAQRTSEGRSLKNIGEDTMFTAIDLNSDGVVTSEEYATHQNKMMSDKRSQKNANKQNRQNKNNNSAMKNRQRPEFADFDTDGDKLISKAEFDAFRESRQQARAAEGKRTKNANADQASMFAKLDTNSDGYISEEEFLTNRNLGRNGKGNKF